jgi:hypothetical protein
MKYASVKAKLSPSYQIFHPLNWSRDTNQMKKASIVPFQKLGPLQILVLLSHMLNLNLMNL